MDLLTNTNASTVAYQVEFGVLGCGGVYRVHVYHWQHSVHHLDGGLTQAQVAAVPARTVQEHAVDVNAFLN